ncbi:hypothetical protein F2P56_034044 [Juglans regia]|uniref:EF-hand domain-containing protein n=1 Tax=Juglans regia TaxID=51240 RepID=A0A833WDK6_JUGRE|nr:hypothetical protein F2P56_034044 [Juglans regia]
MAHFPFKSQPKTMPSCNKNLGPDCNFVPIDHETYKEIRVPKSLAMKYDEAQLREIFKRYDVNGDGVLGRQELRKAFYSLGAYLLSGWRAYQALRHADANGDGYISEAELDDVVRYAVQFGYAIK